MVILGDFITSRKSTANNNEATYTNKAIKEANTNSNSISSFPINNNFLINNGNTSLTNKTLLASNTLLTSIDNDGNQRKQKRLPLRARLFLRRPFNSATYGKEVETVDISANGLQVLCDVSLEVGAELVVSNMSRRVMVTATVKHVSKDAKTNNYLLGLSINHKQTNWFVSQLAQLDYFSKSSTSTSLSSGEDYIC